MGRERLFRSVKEASQRNQKKVQEFSAYLGIQVNGEDTVEVANRPGFHWARMRNQNNEIVQVHNDTVSPVYNMPVIVHRDPNAPDRYKVKGRDIGTYGSNWGNRSTFEPVHSGQHSFNKEDGGTGGDVIWIYTDQYMPFLVSPSGTKGAGNCIVWPYVYHMTGTYHHAGGTGTPDMLDCKPTGGNNARMIMIYLYKPDGNFYLATGSLEEFSETLTGTPQILPYTPYAPTYGVPLAGVRLVTGTTSIGWKNLYDLRELVGAGV